METTMRKLLTLLIALGAIVFAVATPSQAAWIKSAQPFESYLQPVGGVFLFFKRPTSTYVGPGNITFNGSAANVKEFWSCARVVNNAKAIATVPMCDLVQAPSGASPGAGVGTLRASITGIVDLSSAYFPGGVTPAAACAAITGGCNVSKAYGQIGGVGDAVQATNSSQPLLVFSGLNGLPVMNCAGATCILSTSGSFTLAQPFVMSAVYIRNPTSTATGQIVGGGTSTTALISSALSTANRFGCSPTGGGQTAAATDVVWHGGISLFNGTTTSILNVDGANTAGATCGTAGFSAEPIRLFRGAGGANQIDGSMAEAMIVGSTASSADLTNLFAT
jgi:hypothetical protein